MAQMNYSAALVLGNLGTVTFQKHHSVLIDHG